MLNEKHLGLILGNAGRLIRDAEILLIHQRYASAFALAVLGVEEIGKALLLVWEANGPLPKKEAISPHIRKQSAVASLLIGGLIVRRFPDGPDWATLDTAVLTDEFNESDEGRIFVTIRNRALDRRKQNALYQDDAILAVEDDFAERHVQAVLRIANAAQQASTDEIAHRAARTLYCET